TAADHRDAHGLTVATGTRPFVRTLTRPRVARCAGASGQVDARPGVMDAPVLRRARRPVEQPVRRRTGWVATIDWIVGLCLFVPYTLLRDVDAWYGSLLFWSACTAVVIAINAVVSTAWRD